MRTIILYSVGKQPNIVASYAVSNDAADRLTRVAEFVLDDLALKSITKGAYRVSNVELRAGGLFTPVECWADEKVSLATQDIRFSRLITQDAKSFDERRYSGKVPSGRMRALNER